MSEKDYKEFDKNGVMLAPEETAKASFFYKVSEGFNAKTVEEIHKDPQFFDKVKARWNENLQSEKAVVTDFSKLDPNDPEFFNKVADGFNAKFSKEIKSDPQFFDKVKACFYRTGDTSLFK